MTAIETASLLVLIVIGLALTYFGYEAARALLHYGGLAAGVAIGGWVGIVVLPRVTGEALASAEILGVTVVLCLLGAVIGQRIVPRLGRLAVGCLGFTLTAMAALVVFSRGRTLEILTQTIPSSIETRDPDLLFDRLSAVEFVGGVSSDIAFIGILVVAAFGGALALSYKWVILSAGVTVLGALLLAVVAPLLIGGVALESGEVVSSFSELWFVFFLVTGLAFEFVRYSDELELSGLLS